MDVFYLALLLQFVPAGGDILRWSVVLMCVESLTAVICLVAYAVLARVVGKVFERAAVTAWLERVLGSVLIGLSIRIAVT